MTGYFSLGLEIFLAILLLIAIAYCMRLDAKLKALRNANQRMMEAAKEMQSSIIHADNAVTALRRSAEAAGRELQAKIDEARAMAAHPIVREVSRESISTGRDSKRDSARDNVREPLDFSLRRRSVL